MDHRSSADSYQAAAAGQRPGADAPFRRAIGVPLTRRPTGHLRTTPVSPYRASAPLAAYLGAIPKLTVRVRFPSPALEAKAQVNGHPAEPGLPCFRSLCGRRAPYALARPALAMRYASVFEG
jgi:hypothetical protein